MKISLIKIKNIFGITERALDGKSVEITGKNKAGKTSIIDAIRYALKHRAEKDLVLRKGEEEGEVLIETDSGISIRRRERLGKLAIDTVKEGKTPVAKPEAFLRSLFTEMQIDPIGFITLPKEEQNRIILDLIDFKWDMNWIKEQFGEIPSNINWEQNILRVLADIQAENGHYFSTRQEVNREAKNKQAFIEEIVKKLPEGYNADAWEGKNIGELYTKIEKIRESNRKIEKAQTVIDSQEGKKRGFESDKQISLAALDTETNAARSRLEREITRLENELNQTKKDLSGLEENKLKKIENIGLKYKADVAEFESLIEQHKEVAAMKLQDPSDLVAEVQHTEEMKNFVSLFRSMRTYQDEVKRLNDEGAKLTVKIEKARSLPAEILEIAKMPIKSITVENGMPLINGLPISNLSDGEKLDLCIDIATLKKNTLPLILIDGAEKLADDLRERVYARCQERGIQFVATRTTNDDELKITEFAPAEVAA
jgi:exonuclease SbcC